MDTLQWKCQKNPEQSITDREPERDPKAQKIIFEEWCGMLNDQIEQL